jgi:hypothetical protein
VSDVFDELERIYSEADAEIPVLHLEDLGRQIEKQLSRYKVEEEEVEVALALVKPEGFLQELDADGNTVYTADIVYLKERESMLLKLSEAEPLNPHDFGFHYTPYNFDSKPEKSFFEKVLRLVNASPDEVEDVYFTGAITDPAKTDFYVEYKDEHGDWRRYTPDFVIRLKNGKCLIVEIKDERMKEDPVQGLNGRKTVAIRQWEELSPERLKYEMIFAASNVAHNQMKRTAMLIESGDFQLEK